MELTYIGPDGAGVSVPYIDGDIVFAHGVPVDDVPDELAHRLLDEQPAWWSSPGVDPSPAKSASKDEWVAFRSAQGHDVEGLTKDELIDLPDVPAANEEGG